MNRHNSALNSINLSLHRLQELLVVRRRLCLEVRHDRLIHGVLDVAFDDGGNVRREASGQVSRDVLAREQSLEFARQSLNASCSVYVYVATTPYIPA